MENPNKERPSTSLGINDEERKSVRVTIGMSDAVKEENKKYSVIHLCNRVIKYSLYILAFATPLFFLPLTSQALDYNKQALIVILSIIAILAWLIKAVKTGKLVWRRSFANILILVFLASYGASTIFSLSRAGSFFGFLNHPTLSFLSVASFLIIYFLAMNIFQKNNSQPAIENKNLSGLSVNVFQGKIFQFMFWGIAASGAVGLIQLLGKSFFPWEFAKSAAFNTVGTFNSLALLLAVGVILGLSLVKRNTENGSPLSPLAMKKIMTIMAIITTIFMFAMIVLINFWLAWLALAIGIVILLVFSSRGFTKGKIFFLPVIFLILTIIFWQFGFVYDLIPIKANTPVEIYPTTKASFEVIKGVFGDKLLFGSGPETFVFDWSKYKPEGVNLSDLWYVRFNSPTNWWMNILASGGVVSLLAIGFFIVYVFYKGIRLSLRGRFSDGPGLTLLSLFAALTIGKIFYPSNIVLEFYFWIAAGLLAGILSKYETEKRRFKLNLNKFPRVSAAVSFVLIFAIISGFALIFIKAQHYSAEMNYKKSLTALVQKKNWDITIDYLLKAARLNRFQDTYSRELSRMYLQRATEEMSELNQKKKDVSEAGPRIQKFVQNAVGFAENATNLSSNDVANWIQKARVYDSVTGYFSDANKKAIESWQKAAELEPANPYIYTQLGVSYLVKADIALQAKDKELQGEMAKEAENSFIKAAELKENYAPAHYQLAALYEKQGKIADAVRKLETTLSISKNEPGLAFQLGIMYLKNNQKDRAKTAFVIAIKLNPNYSDAKWYLALILESEGDLANAIKLVEQVYELNSQNEDVRTKLEALKKGQISQIPPGQKPPLGQELEERP